MLTQLFSPCKDNLISLKRKFYTRHLLEAETKTLFRTIAIWEKLLQQASDIELNSRYTKNSWGCTAKEWNTVRGSMEEN